MAARRGAELADATRTAELVAVEGIAEGTIALRMRKPKGFTHTAGQSTILTLPEGLGLEGEDREHQFTIASAPHEAEVLIATRVGGRDSPWKKAAQDLDPGARIGVDAADGDFTLHEDASQPAVFLAGGIGITPFRAMLRDVAHRGEDRELTLFYSNSKPAEAAFLGELHDLDDEVGGFTLVATMTHAPDWDGEHGRIDGAMLRRHLGDLRGPVYYAAGPPAMVRDMRRMLLAEGVPKEAIQVEEFTGY